MFPPRQGAPPGQQGSHNFHASGVGLGRRGPGGGEVVQHAHIGDMGAEPVTGAVPPRPVSGL